MANKQMNQLATISGVASNDLVLVYDVSDITTEKTKSILYSDFESVIGENLKPTTLYYNDLIALTASADGVTVRDTNSTGPKILLTGNNDATVGQIYATATNTQLQVGSALETGIKMTYNGATELYHNNSSKIQTTSSGVDVDGTIVCNDIYTDGSSVHIGDTVLSDSSGSLRVNDEPLGSFTKKNAIINGDFNIWQRNTALTPITTGEFVADRFTCSNVTDLSLIHI